jgi:hypothetical protein
MANIVAGMLTNVPNDVPSIYALMNSDALSNNELKFYMNTANEESRNARFTEAYRNKARTVRNTARNVMRVRREKRSANLDRAALERRSMAAAVRGTTIHNASTRRKPLAGPSPLRQVYTIKNTRRR